MLQGEPQHTSTWSRLVDGVPVRPLVALASVIALVATVPRFMAEAMARGEPVVVLGLVLVAVAGLVGARSGGAAGRILAATATAIVVTVAVSLVTAMPADHYVDQICASGCVVAPQAGGESTGPVLQAWIITGLANLVPIVAGLWVAGRLNRWMAGEDEPAAPEKVSSDTIANRVSTGAYRTQLKNVRLIRGMRTALFPWRH